MKKLLFIFSIVSCLFAGNAFAVPGTGGVGGTLGVKLGANFNQLNGGTWEQAYKPGILIGAFGSVKKNSWGLRVEATLNSAQYAVKDSLAQHTWKALYLDIPVLVEYKLMKRLWLQGGVQLSRVLSMTSNNSDVTNPKSYFNAGNFSGVVGLEGRLPLHIVAGARYVMGVTDIKSPSIVATGDAWKTRTIQLYLGFRFL